MEHLGKRDAGEKGIQAIKRMSRDLNIPKGFKNLEPKEEDILTLAENAMKNATALTNPRKPKLEEVIEIYKGAM